MYEFRGKVETLGGFWGWVETKNAGNDCSGHKSKEGTQTHTGPQVRERLATQSDITGAAGTK